MFKPSTYLAALFLFVAASISGCGGGGSSAPNPAPTPQPTQSNIYGTAIKGPISGAQIRVFRFNASGDLEEFPAANAPVTTDAGGAFSFALDVSNVPAGTGPLILVTSGGTMFSEAAPQLSGIVADPSALAAAGGASQVHLSVASSVAAGLVRQTAEQSGTAPTIADATGVITRVEEGLNVNLSDDPTIANSSIAFLNRSIDANLNLHAMPENAPAVGDLIDYMVMNFASESGKFDDRMMDPDNKAETNAQASFNGCGDGTLANVMEGGPGTFMFFTAELDRETIENNGLDTAFLDISVTDAMGNPAGDGRAAKVQTTAGRLVVSRNNPVIEAGSASVNISSVWAGAAGLSASMTLPAGTSVSYTFELNVVDNEADVEDTENPRISGAGSTGNRQVLVAFSEAMRGGMESAENPGHYRIVATETLASDSPDPGKTDRGDTGIEKPEVLIEDAELILPDRTTVRLTTFSQSDLEYEIAVVNLTDIRGNAMAAPERAVDPSRATFHGTPPSGAEVVDSDGDGLSDSDEQRGWVVTFVSADGKTITLEVTSDPFTSDTDGDGLSDADEFQGGLSPRSADSDGDTLTDYMEWHVIHSNGLKQDTDGDGLQDGIEFNKYRTSPILADTDGDQLDDPDEIAAGNRNPLISDLPSPRIDVGNVNLQLDTRFSFTSETGKSVVENKTFESTIARGEDETFSTSNKNSTKKTLQFSEELGVKKSWGPKPGVEVSFKGGSKQGSERASTFTTSRESSKSSEETYHDSLSTATSRDIRESVTRDVVDAAMKVTLSIDNVGDIPFTISNLELSAETQDPLDRRRMIPVAALVPENANLGSVNIGTLGDPSRGPFVFKTVSVFPQQVQELMKNPRGLIVQLANFDITDNDGNNFAFTSQEVLDRTAGLTFDMGDGRVESYRVATASTHDPATGKPAGVTMAYMLDVIGLQRYETIRDGGNGIAETVAFGDDIAVAGADLAVEPGEIVVKAGSDGAITSSPGGDDVLVQPDYETELQKDFDRILDGGNGIAETLAVGDDTQLHNQGAAIEPNQVIITVGNNELLDTPVAAGDDVVIRGSVPDHHVLTRFRDVERSEVEERFWVMFASNLQLGVDLERYVVRAGDQFDFAFVQDKDDDGVWAREEFLHGSSDLLVNSDGCTVVPAGTPCDMLSDKEEIQVGWRVQLRGSPEGNIVYPNPNQGDSDRDRLTDDEEKACLLDPRQRDTDLDGLTDWEELNGKIIIEGVVTDMVSRDYDTNAVVYVITPYEGNDPAETGVIPHDVTPGCSPSGFATDPLNDDTDGDLVDDWLELQLGLNPNDPSDGPTFLDDDGDGLPNSVETSGWIRTINASDLEDPVNDVLLTSNPNTVDTDNDLLPDLLEHYIGSDPVKLDTDGDGITDTNEYKTGGEACVTNTAGQICVPWLDRSAFTYLEYLSKCASAAICDNAAIEQNLGNAQARNYGTNLSEIDSDFDSLDDKFELTMRYITVDGAVIPVDSDPLSPNSDDDQLDDGEENVAGTNPRNGDTDDDGTNDDAEAPLGRDPTVTDKRLYIEVTSAVVVNTDGDAGGGAEPRVDVFTKLDDGSWEKRADINGNDIEQDDSFLDDPIVLFEGVFISDTRLEVSFEGYEEDTCWSGCLNTHDMMTTERETIWIDTAPASGEETITIDMRETDGDATHFRFVLTVREILAQ
jgi:hypothetical protein